MVSETNRPRQHKPPRDVLEMSKTRPQTSLGEVCAVRDGSESVKIEATAGSVGTPRTSKGCYCQSIVGEQIIER